jgi:hypothetical protein
MQEKNIPLSFQAGFEGRFESTLLLLDRAV